MVAIDNILKKYKRDRSFLLEIIHDIENVKEKKNIDTEDINAIAKYLNLNLSEVYSVVTFYTMFSLKQRAKYIIRVCASTSCQIKKYYDTLTFLEKFLECNENGVSRDGLFKIEKVECLGSCDMAPAMIINDMTYGSANADKIKKIIKDLRDANNSA